MAAASRSQKPASTMGISRWFCKNSTKNMVVKIVHPGGHKELHDRTLLASEIMNRNPRCVVAYPDVFKQPWNIVEPETTLMLGQKYYVVPTSTVRKLQRHFLRNSPLQHTKQNCETSGHNLDEMKGDNLCSCSWNSDDEKCFGFVFNGAKSKEKLKNQRKSTSRPFTESEEHWQPGLESIREELSHSNVSNLIRKEHSSND